MADALNSSVKELTSKSEIVDELNEFSIVMDISWTGEIKNLIINDRVKGIDPEKVAKASALVTWAIRGLGSLAGNECIHEVDVLTDKGLIILFPNREGVKVGISAPL